MPIKDLMVAVLFATIFLSGNVNAQQQDDVEFAPKQQNLRWSPGEAYNALNGTMNYLQTDLYLPGNGKLPIEITRRFLQRPVRSPADEHEPTYSFGHFTMDAPSFYFRTGDGGDEAILCNRYGALPTHNRSLQGYAVFSYGDTKQVFYKSGNRLINTNGWKAECLPFRGSIGRVDINGVGNVVGSFIITRPDGVKYEMWVNSFGSGQSAAGFHWTTVYAVKQISDPYGNTLTYNYDSETSVFHRRLLSITANDGRRAEFTYSNDTVGSAYYQRILTIETNSGKNPVRLAYAYPQNQLIVTKNETERTTINLSGNHPDVRISRIHYPTGGTVDYAYHDARNINGAIYKRLKTRSTSEGASYDFSYTDNGDKTFVRHIKTPSAWLDYTYGEPKKPIGVGNVVNHLLTSGRLIKFSRSEPGFAGGLAKKIFSVDYEYVNLTEWSNNQLVQVVKPKKITTKMKYDTLGNARAVFITENTQFDRWGYPREVIESDPTGLKIRSTISYESDYYDVYDSRVVVGKVRRSIQPMDVQSYTYNEQGDVTSHTDNGITTTYRWHESGESMGEMKYMSTALRYSTSYNNYKRGQAQLVTTTGGYAQSKVVNDNGTLASQTRFTKFLDPNTSQRTLYEYDNRRRLQTVTPERDLSARVYTQWISNNLSITNDENNNRYLTRELFDSFGRIRVKNSYDRDQRRSSALVYEYDSEGRHIFTSYPVDGNYTTESSVPGNLPGIHYQYDALDRVMQIRHDEEAGNDTVTYYQYDADNGPLLSVRETDGRGSVNTTTYRSYGVPHYEWPVKIVDADNQTSYISRVGSNGLIESHKRGNQTTSYTYNSKNQLDTIRQSENGETVFTYDGDGRLKSRTNNGRAVQYEYYADGRISKEIYTDSSKEGVTREYLYDKYRNLEYSRTTSANGTQNNSLHYRYDEDNNILSMTLSIDDRDFQLQFDYDELSNVKQITYPNGRVYALHPNSLGSPTIIQELGGSGKTIYDQIQYHANHSMKLMQRSAHQVENEQNRGSRPYHFKLKNYTNGQLALAGERRYQYDKAANLSKINDTVSGRYMVLSYDSRNRLINENISNADNWSYSYLPNDDIDWIQHGGIRLRYEYDPNTKRLSSVKTDETERVYEYDRQGNMTVHERLQGDSKVTQLLTRNSANQLVAMSDGTKYSYDARGIRVKKSSNGSIYTLYGPNERLMFRFDTLGDVSSEYFYVNGKLVARRDTDLSGEAPAGSPDENTSDITVDGLTISWPDDGWYQVQTDDGLTNICEGGRSCTVPAGGVYKVINHSKDTKTRVTVESSSPGNLPLNGISVKGLTISWPDDGWYQVQTDDGLTNICEGGQSCTVPAAGVYKVINLSKGKKTRVKAG